MFRFLFCVCVKGKKRVKTSFDHDKNQRKTEHKSIKRGQREDVEMILFSAVKEKKKHRKKRTNVHNLIFFPFPSFFFLHFLSSNKENINMRFSAIFLATVLALAGTGKYCLLI